MDAPSAPGAVLWRNLRYPGHEYARVASLEGEWHLEGVAVLAHESAPCRLEYRVRCSSDWITLGARVSGRVGTRLVAATLVVTDDRSWWLEGAERPAVAGCLDLDLGFSPSTNTLPIRRLSLAVGERRQVRAAWLRFPSLELEPLEQTYSRLAEDRYLYESAGGRFRAELLVDPSGLVREYAGGWAAEPEADRAR